MAYCSLEFQRSPKGMSFDSYIWDLGKGKRKPPPSVMLPLRKHFVPSKSVMKPRSTPEGAKRGLVSSLPTDQCGGGEEWGLKALQQVERQH